MQIYFCYSFVINTRITNDKDKIMTTNEKYEKTVYVDVNEIDVDKYD